MLGEKVYNLLAKEVENLGYQIVAVKLVTEDHNLFLRIIIDKDSGITLDDCVTVTNLINPILDKNADMFKDTYILDVCSKGTEEI